MEPKYIKVSQYAKIHNLNYKTALRQFHAGRIEGYQDKIFTTRGNIENIKDSNKNLNYHVKILLNSIFLPPMNKPVLLLPQTISLLTLMKTNILNIKLNCHYL
jgi:hypothetical protein